MTAPVNVTKSMTPAQAKKLAIMAPLVIVALAFVADNTSVDKTDDIDMLRVLAGAVVLMVLLSLFAEAAPEIAAGFAWLILISGVFVLGDKAFAGIARLVGAPYKAGGSDMEGVGKVGGIIPGK